MRNVRSTLFAMGLGLLLAAPSLAQGGNVITRLRGFEEVPAVANPNGGTFTASINRAGTEMAFNLTYTVPEGVVTQAHLHFAQRGVNGGIVIFLCSNLGNGPAGTPACPANNGTVTGTITSEDVLAVAAQSAAAGDLASVLRAIRAGIVYANVHTDQLPGGSIRGQLLFTPND
jgi:hypothetical protein